MYFTHTRTAQAIVSSICQTQKYIGLLHNLKQWAGLLGPNFVQTGIIKTIEP
jgi:hypothetical protein